MVASSKSDNIGFKSPSSTGALANIQGDLEKSCQINDGYVTINGVDPSQSSNKEDEKALSLTGVKVSASSKPMVMANRMKSSVGSKGIRSGTNGTLVKIWERLTFASSSNAAQFFASAITPIGATDFSSFIGVYDLFRLKRVKFHAVMNPTVAAPTAADTTWGLAWDPCNSAAYSSSSDVFTARRKLGPITPANAYATSNTATGDGLHTLDVVLETPKQTITNDTNAEVIGGGWSAAQSTATVCGYIKGFASALGTGSVSNVIIWVEMDVEFKSRT